MTRARVRLFGALAVSLLSMSCASAGGSEAIFKPMSFRSPQLDFSKVQAMAIMPINATTDEVPELTALINDGLPSELKRSQSAWKILGHDEVLRTLNDKGLGRGYQNYLADLNTYSMVAGTTPNFTAETKTFFSEIKKEMKIEAILFTSYGFKEETVVQPALFGMVNVPVQRKVLTVSVILYEISSQRTWWVSKLTVQSTGKQRNADLAAEVLKGIANSFGKGDLRQL